MLPKSRRSVQKKHPKRSPKWEGTNPGTNSVSPAPLLFVNKGQHNLRAERSIEEQTAIKIHLSQRQSQRNHQKPISFHASTQRILNQNEEKGIDEINIQLANRLTQSPRSTHNQRSLATIANQFPVLCQPLGTTVLDPFVPETVVDRDVIKLLILYLRHIRPLAATVSLQWDWIENASEIQTSEMLSNAIAAYTSAFFSGMKGGSQSVVLPPVPEKGRQPLWEIPQWFRYYTKCLSLLSEGLTDQVSSGEVFHTILFLLRLTVLFGDGPAANMHFKALRQVALVQGRSLTMLGHEASVTQVNFITLFLYKAAMVKTATNRITEEHPDYVIEPDKTQWTSEREWTKFAGMLYGRSLTWHAKAVDVVSARETQQIVLRLDPGTRQLPTDTFENLARHYRIGLFLWSYLVGINYDPSLPKIKLHVSQLEEFLKSRNTVLLESVAPKIVFFLYFCGTYGSRGQPCRDWFIHRLLSTKIQVRTMRDLWAELENFADPAHCMPILLEEILHEMGRSDIYSGGRYCKWYGPNPMVYEPDLQTPIRELQLQNTQPRDAA